MSIKIEQLTDREGYKYRYKTGWVIAVAEIHGHGCLFGIEFPPETSVKGMCWQGDKTKPLYEDVLVCLNAVLADYHCSERIMRGSLEPL